MAFENGISGYVEAHATVTVYFPIDSRGNAYIDCKHCPFLSSNERICQLNKEAVAFPTKYVGGRCPLEPIEIENQKSTQEVNEK